MSWPTDDKPYNPWEEWGKQKGEMRGDLFLKMAQATAIKLDTLEEYEERSLYPDEIVGFIYDIMDECPSVYGVPPNFLRYCMKTFQIHPLAGSPGIVDHAIERGLKDQGANWDNIPMIPIMEYKLVPTGYINWFDPRLNTNQRRDRRCKYNEATLLRNKKYKEKKNKGGRPRKKRPEEEIPQEPINEEEDLDNE